MPLYFIKPIVWNTNDYKIPSGAKFTSGYPKDHGFGHEEWNNSERCEFDERGQKFRLFYTEHFGDQPLDQHREDIFIFMVASHNGKQFLVGVAGGATSLRGDQNREEREHLVKKCKLGGNLWREAWALDTVKACYKNNEQAFRDQWKFSPTWKCSSDLFFWLENPLLLDPLSISGKKKLIQMYGSYQEITRQVASDILNSILPPENPEALNNLKARCAGNDLDLVTDVAELQATDSLNVTTRETLIQARLGQGKFRDNLLEIWKGACAVTSCSINEVLRASHIRPWRNSSNRQKVDPNNGLLLEANLDALFDAGLIAFLDSGEMLISKLIRKEEQKRLGLPRPLRLSPNPSQQKHLAFHRDHIWKDRGLVGSDLYVE